MTGIRVAAMLLGLAVAIGLVSCSSSSSSSPIKVLDAVGEPESNELWLGTDGCNQHPQASVEETETEVRVTVTGDPETGDDCKENILVTLDDVLGDRKVIDEFTGAAVEVRVAAH